MLADMEEPMWVERYRPLRVQDAILPSHIKATFQKFVDTKDIPLHMLLVGGPGMGKTTCAIAMLKEIGADYIKINASLSGKIEVLRTNITGFASTVSFYSKRKFVVLDEADFLTFATQPALRGFMEEFSKNCSIIFTANAKSRIIEPIWSRCSVIDFTIPEDERDKLVGDFFKRTIAILNNEKVQYDKKVVGELVLNYFPDMRRILNELQQFAMTGPIDNRILAKVKDVSFEALMRHMKARSFSDARKWVAENAGLDAGSFVSRFYEMAAPLLTSPSIPLLCIALDDFQNTAPMAVDQEIHMAATLAKIMVSVEWK